LTYLTEVSVVLVCAVSFMIMAFLVEPDDSKLVLDILSAIFWFSSSFIWLIDGGLSPPSVLFLGLGVLLSVLALDSTLKVFSGAMTRESEEDEED